MNDNAKRAQAWLWLTAPIAVFTAIAAGSGLFMQTQNLNTPFCKRG